MGGPSSSGKSKGSGNLSTLEKNSLKYGNNEFSKFIKDNKEELKAKGLFTPEKATAIWKDARYKNSITDLKPISREDAISIVTDQLPNNLRQGWFVEANSDYKPAIEAAIIGSKELRNAGLNIAYENYKNVTGTDISFSKFLNSEITVYRGGNNDKFIASDVFKSYSFDKSIAEGFGSNVQSIKVKPIDTLGSYQTTAEAEILVRVK